MNAYSQAYSVSLIVQLPWSRGGGGGGGGGRGGVFATNPSNYATQIIFCSSDTLSARKVLKRYFETMIYVSLPCISAAFGPVDHVP